jgi:hypothetical protein
MGSAFKAAAREIISEAETETNRVLRPIRANGKEVKAPACFEKRQQALLGPRRTYAGMQIVSSIVWLRARHMMSIIWWTMRETPLPLVPVISQTVSQE